MIALLAGLAMAAPCVDDGMAEGPVVAGLLDGDLGRARRACFRSELGLSAGGLAVVDTPSFYGHVVGGATVDGSLALDHRTELFGSVELVRYDSVISGLTSSWLGPGHTAVGAARVLTSTDAGVLTLHGKAVLPTAVGLYQNSWPFGVDLGLSGTVGAGPLALHGQVGALASAAASRGASQPRLGVASTVGAEWRAGRAFALVADLSGGFGYTAPLDVLGAGFGLRFSDGRRWGLELGATLPLAGRERALATFELRNSLRF